MSAHDPEECLEANVPQPRSERGAWALAIGLGALGVAVLALALSGVLGGVSSSASAPPPVLAVTPTPTPTPTAVTAPVGEHGVAGHRAIVGDPSSLQVHRDFAAYVAQTSTPVAEGWMQSFYPIYAVAQRTFGVSWLLIASIHKQESAFSTAPSTYKGLNFAGCCGGPMQFNVTNGGAGIPSTWALVSDSYRYGARPAAYDHMTAKHPSIYDDFDSIMAAAHLLSSDGAGNALDGAAWNAAYDYYGHDPTGVTYADQVLARAIGWSQHGFCVNCGIETSLVETVHAAYGAPVAASLETATVARKAKRRPPARSAHPRRGR
jgi:hypothetical protein